MFVCCEHTQLSILRAAKGVQVSFAVHHHAEFSSTSHLHQGLAIVGNLEGVREGSQYRRYTNMLSMKPLKSHKVIFKLKH